MRHNPSSMKSADLKCKLVMVGVGTAIQRPVHFKLDALDILAS